MHWRGGRRFVVRCARVSGRGDDGFGRPSLPDALDRTRRERWNAHHRRLPSVVVAFSLGDARVLGGTRSCIRDGNRAISPGFQNTAPGTRDRLEAFGGGTRFGAGAGIPACCRPAGPDDTGKVRMTLDSTGKRDAAYPFIPRRIGFGAPVIAAQPNSAGVHLNNCVNVTR